MMKLFAEGQERTLTRKETQTARKSRDECLHGKRMNLDSDFLRLATAETIYGGRKKAPCQKGDRSSCALLPRNVRRLVGVCTFESAARKRSDDIVVADVRGDGCVTVARSGSNGRNWDVRTARSH